MMPNEAVRRGLLTVGAVLSAFALATPAAAQETGQETGAEQQQTRSSGGRARVLVTPIVAEDGVDEEFGRNVSDEVRERLRSVATVTAIEEQAVEDELDRLELDQDDLGLVQWRQLAGRLDADLVLHGTVSRASGGNAFNVSFVDAGSGDATQIPEFVVQGDGGDEAEEAADHIMQAIEGYVEYLRSLLFCSDYMGTEEYEDALRNCEEALEYNPNSLTARYLIGRVYMGLENWELAQENLAAVVEERPAHIDALNSLAFTEAKLGNHDRAMELYELYLGFNPDDPAVRMQIAYDLATAGDYDGAIELLQEGLARDSTNAEMWKFLGDVALNKGTTASEPVPGADSADATTQAAAGETGEVGVTDEQALHLALEAYEKVLELKGAETDPQLLKNVVAVYMQLGDLDEARRFAQRAQEQLPEDASLRSLQADICARAEDYECAVAAMDEALRLDPDFPQGLTKRGFFKMSAGNEAGAMRDLRAAVESGEDPSAVAGALLGRGFNDYFKSGDYGRAIALFEAAIELAEPGTTLDQLHFYTAYAHYYWGDKIDRANMPAEACGPARKALNKFQQVLPHLNQAGDVQTGVQAQIRKRTDIYLYREQSILEKPACN